MITVRKSEHRGHANHGWLDSHHTFSFSDYYDSAHLGFRDLLVINEDRVQPGQGFGRHGHQDMEIISYVLEGELEHRDSLGNGAVLRPGDVQRMSAGTGVRHSEFNHSKQHLVHFLQIWIQPAKQGVTPSYEDKNFPLEERRNRLRLLVSPDGADGSLVIHQDARVYATLLEPGREVALELASGRRAWVQVARGDGELNGIRLTAGDGAAIEGESSLRWKATTQAEILVFDLR